MQQAKVMTRKPTDGEKKQRHFPLSLTPFKIFFFLISFGTYAIQYRMC